jgi:ethanolamine utilization protein EutA (predicted chaperonin)
MKTLKANVGDFVLTKAGPRRVATINGEPGSLLASYELENGSLIADIELGAEDVLPASSPALS